MVDKELDVPSCRQAVSSLASFLASNNELAESGKGGLQEFFLEDPDLLLLAGDCFGPRSFTPAAYKSEYSIFGEFRADFAVANATRDKFLFIEFEDAKRDSVFKEKTSGSSSISYEWSKRFEHGYSQVVDWHYRMDDMSGTSRLEESFGVSMVEYDGLLVIGRDHFIREAGGVSRLRWRKDKTVVNSRRIHCLTFDALLSEIAGRLETIEAILSSQI
jgi:hypothetical protein